MLWAHIKDTRNHVLIKTKASLFCYHWYYSCATFGGLHDQPRDLHSDVSFLFTVSCQTFISMLCIFNPLTAAYILTATPTYLNLFKYVFKTMLINEWCFLSACSCFWSLTNINGRAVERAKAEKEDQQRHELLHLQLHHSHWNNSHFSVDYLPATTFILSGVYYNWTSSRSFQVTCSAMPYPWQRQSKTRRLKYVFPTLYSYLFST